MIFKGIMHFSYDVKIDWKYTITKSLKKEIIGIKFIKDF